VPTFISRVASAMTPHLASMGVGMAPRWLPPDPPRESGSSTFQLNVHLPVTFEQFEHLLSKTRSGHRRTFRHAGWSWRRAMEFGRRIEPRNVNKAREPARRAQRRQVLRAQRAMLSYDIRNSACRASTAPYGKGTALIRPRSFLRNFTSLLSRGEGFSRGSKRGEVRRAPSNHRRAGGVDPDAQG